MPPISQDTSKTQSEYPDKQKSQKRVVIVGNPNSGKTTLFNALTGLNYKVANYPGVTVERRESTLKISSDLSFQLVDLPGLYSFSSLSIDEQIASNEVLGLGQESTPPDLILCVVDASNLERNLYLASQLIDSGLKIIIVLTITDLASKLGISIKTEILARLLDVPIVSVQAVRGQGLEQLKIEIKKSLNTDKVASKAAFAWAKNQDIFLRESQTLGDEIIKQRGAITSASPQFLGVLLLSEKLLTNSTSILQQTQKIRSSLLSQKIDAPQIEATERYRWISRTVSACTEITDTRSKRRREIIDAITTHRILGPILFVIVMTVMFQSIFTWATIPMDIIDSSINQFGKFVAQQLGDGILKSLIVDGIIAGVGSVVIFIPQIAILFFFLGLLEESGYLSRAAFLMDRVMRPFGLQGRAFIPLLSCFACAVPGIMSTRSIPSFTDRLVTILVAPLMSCSARLPVYTVLIAAVIPKTYLLGFISVQGLIMLGLYLLGIIGAAVVGLILRATIVKGSPSLFVMEMPPYRRPSLKNVVRDVLERVRLFLVSAGTTILACSLVLWFLASFPRGDIKNSFAGMLGHLIEPIITPLGFNWELGIGILASFAAREVFVSTLGTVYSLQDSSDASGSLIQELQIRVANGNFSLATAASLLVFFVFACQCMSTIAVTKRETASWKWPTIMFLYMTTLAYAASFITYQLLK